MTYSVNMDYAVVYLDNPKTPLRPLRGMWTGTEMEVHDPDDPLDFPEPVPLTDLTVLGVWNRAAHPSVGGRGNFPGLTWAQLAADQHRHVQSQRLLVERLGKVGIRRTAEPYIHGRSDQANAVELGLILTYTELDLLLRRGGA